MDIENLERLSFERSKFWANLINKFEEKGDDGKEFTMDLNEDQEDENLEDENDDASIDSSNEAEEVDVFEDEDIINGTMIGGSHTLSTMLLHGGNTADIETLLNCEEGNAELQDLLNETVPLLREHKRKWEEAGINRVLNTFDRQKIEEKEEGWLRRNHSGIDALSISPVVASASVRRCCNPKITSSKRNVYHTLKTKKTVHVTETKDSHVVETDTDTSLHSVDTARYIRSSRQQGRGSGSRGVLGKRLGSSTSTAPMTIKTFRLVQKEREALRVKYACLDDDADDNDFHCRRSAHAPPCHRYDHQQQQNTHQVANKANNIALRTPAAEALEERRCYHRSQVKIRRKNLRKHRHASISSTSSSDSYLSLSFSSVDNGAKHNEAVLKKGHRRYKSLKHRRHRVSKRSVSYRTICCGRAYRHSLSSSSSHSYVYAECDCKVKRLQRAKKDKEIDMRPTKRESDCRCCSDIKLCKETQHLADTSTEDWMVENCDSPTKERNLALPSCHRQNLENKESRVSALVKYYEQNKQNAHKHMLAHSTKEAKIGAHVKDAELKIEKKESVLQPTRKTSRIVKPVQTEGNKNLFPSCSSKAEPLKQNDCKKSKPSVRKARKRQTQKNKKRHCDEVDEDRDSDVKFRKELEKAIEISKKTYEKERQLTTSADLKENNNRKSNGKSISPPKDNTTGERKTTTLVDNEVLSISSQSDTYETPIKKLLTKPQPRSVKLRKLAEMSAKKSLKYTTDDTFFHCPKNIYNSTALANDSAMPRTFFNGPTQTGSAKPSAKKVSSATAISSTVHSNASSSSCNSMRSSCSPVNENNDNDCTIVSSTTGFAQQQTQQQAQSHAPQDILLYKPSSKGLAPGHSTDNGFINITQAHLVTVMGEKHARKFLKYYIGRRRFNINSTIYYRPPKQQQALQLNADISSASDDDELESVFKYGDLYESCMNMG